MTAYRAHAVRSHVLQPSPPPLPQTLFPNARSSSCRCHNGERRAPAESGRFCNRRRHRTSVQETATTESEGRVSEGRSRQQKPNKFWSATTALTGVMLKQLLRSKQQGSVWRHVRHLPRAQLAERRFLGESSDVGLQGGTAEGDAAMVWGLCSCRLGRAWFRNSSRRNRVAGSSLIAH